MMVKRYFYIPVTVCIAIIALASCKNTSNNVGKDGSPSRDNNYVFKAPVVTPLVFTKPEKINWKTSQAIITPVTQPFDLDKLPDSSSTDSAGFKPITKPVYEAKFDYNSLPSINLDIDKLPAKSFRFRPYISGLPKIINAGPLHSSTVNTALDELSEYQGLSGKNVFGILTDHNGFLWITTDKGVYRYDGEKLVSYFSTTDLYIPQIIEDKSDKLWMIIGGTGLMVFDTKTGIMQSLRQHEGLSAHSVENICLDDKQRVWAVCNGIINIIDTKTMTIKTLRKAQGVSERVNMISRGRNNNMWITTGGDGLGVIDLKNDKISYIKKAQGLPSDSCSTILCDHKDRIWVKTYGPEGGELNVIDYLNNNIQYVSATGTILRFFEDPAGNVWVGTTHGVIAVNFDKRQANTILISPSYSGSSNIILNICGDKTGGIWLATLNGLYFKKQYNNIVQYAGTNVVSSLCEDNNGSIWIGDNHGVHVFNRKNNTYKNITVKNGLSNNNIETVTAVNGNIFICSDGGLDIINPGAKTIEHIKPVLGGKRVNAFLSDKAGDIWMGTNEGIDVFDPQNKTEKHLGIAEGLTDSLVDDMHLDKQNRIWVVNPAGAVDIIDPQKGILKHLNNQPGFKVNGDKVFLNGETENIWIGTTKGIYIVNQADNTLTSFSTPQGLIGEAVISLLRRGNNIYAATTKGLSIIRMPQANDPDKTWQVTSYGKDDGVNKNNGSFLTDLITKDGLYWWGDEGVSVFDLSGKTERYKPKIFITGFNLMDKPAYFTGQHELEEKDTLYNLTDTNFYTKGQIPLKGYNLNNNPGGEVTAPYNLPADLELSHDQNYLQFHFISLNLTKTDTTAYRYKLEGFDEQWNDPTNETSTRNYFNLSPGKYTFKVECLGNNGLWGTPASFSFIILPPWWQTWWGRLIFVVLLICIIWAFAHYRSLQLVKANRILEHKIHVRTGEVMQQKEEIEAQRDNLEAAVKELKLTQAQLIQSEKLASLGELTAGIAHEIQNPLNFINNFAEVNQEMIDELKEELKNGNYNEVLVIANDIQQNEEKINHHGKRADFIVKGMLQHSRTSTGEKQLTNINVLADEFLKLSYHGLRAKDKSFNAEIITNFDEGMPKVNIVQQDIGRVLLNLFNNAFYAVNQKRKTAGPDYQPTVTVTTFFAPASGPKGADMGGWGVKVKDNGNGIPEAIKDKIMQPFFTTKPTGEGTGLGLSLSYDIIKAHQGELKVETRDGEFSEFIIFLSQTSS